MELIFSQLLKILFLPNKNLNCWVLKAARLIIFWLYDQTEGFCLGSDPWFDSLCSRIMQSTHLYRPIVGPEYGYFCGRCERVFSCYEISFIACAMGHASETLWIIHEAVCISYSLTSCITGPTRRSQLLSLPPLDVSHPQLGHPQVHLVSLWPRKWQMQL